MNKKAQGLSLSVIIIATLVLLVLIILSTVFMARMGVFRTEVAKCELSGGTCQASCDGAAGETQIVGYECSTGVCCIT